jgi:hypothetical protein
VALFVLGAGATRGCSFIDAFRNPCIPPLDSDFFTQLQRVKNPKHQKLIKEVIGDVVALFGTNFRVTLENVFATLEHTIRMLRTTGDTRAFNREELVEKRDRLLQAIAVVLEESLGRHILNKPADHDHCECEQHATLVENALKAGDDILSFNYDCTIDYALKNHGANKWNPRYGYGFGLGPRGSNLTGDRFWSPSQLTSEGNTIHLYKLHGSLHFQITEKSDKLKIILKQRPYTRQFGNLRFTIIPPESNKAYDKGAFRILWSRAAAAIKRATNIVFVGYSLPPTDLHSTALFRTAVSKEQLSSLVIINPDAEVRQRTRSILHRGLKPETRVMSFDRLSEFLAADLRLWRS